MEKVIAILCLLFISWSVSAQFAREKILGQVQYKTTGTIEKMSGGNDAETYYLRRSGAVFAMRTCDGFNTNSPNVKATLENSAESKKTVYIKFVELKAYGQESMYVVLSMPNKLGSELNPKFTIIHLHKLA